jgi:MerR family transcriptional regulator, redox-sensitive transcriptional activator SoxR
MVTGLSIGEVARRAGLRPSALRYYEQVGLLAPQLRASGQRRYDPDVLNTLALIAYARRAGFTIAETRHLLRGFETAVPTSDRWRDLGARKEQELDALIARAVDMKQAAQRIQQCDCQNVTQCGQRLRTAQAQGMGQGAAPAKRVAQARPRPRTHR